MTAPGYTEIKIHLRTLIAMRARAKDGAFDTAVKPSGELMWFLVPLGNGTLREIRRMMASGETLDDALFRILSGRGRPQ